MNDNRSTRGLLLVAVLGLSFAGWLAAARAGQEAVSSRAYVGHEIDADMNGFIRQYPAAAGTRLDDCQTCHRGGVRGTDTEREYSPCGYCHLLVYPNPIDPSAYEKGTGRLSGEGPFRLVKPQRDISGDPAKPGRPDRSNKAKLFGDGWDFVPGMDHNAGACVRGACVIRVNPMPEDYEEYDWKNGWPLIGDKRVVIFGRGVR